MDGNREESWAEVRESWSSLECVGEVFGEFSGRIFLQVVVWMGAGWVEVAPSWRKMRPSWTMLARRSGLGHRLWVGSGLVLEHFGTWVGSWERSLRQCSSCEDKQQCDVLAIFSVLGFWFWWKFAILPWSGWLPEAS